MASGQNQQLSFVRHFAAPLVGVIATLVFCLIAALLWLTAQQNAMALERDRHFVKSALSVADTGPGVAAADRDRIAQRFIRLEGSRTRAGHGLGLNLVAAVARLHRGHLRFADNAPGLVAEIDLPRDQALRAD